MQTHRTFCTLHLLDGESPVYIVSHFYRYYKVIWVTSQGSPLNKHTHRYVCLCCVKQPYFFIFLFWYIIQIKERVYLTSLTCLAFLNAA
jgi:hypothetical protein